MASLQLLGFSVNTCCPASQPASKPGAEHSRWSILPIHTLLIHISIHSSAA